jgi:Ca2+-binding EF-hand superfamily protein
MDTNQINAINQIINGMEGMLNNESSVNNQVDYLYEKLDDNENKVIDLDEFSFLYKAFYEDINSRSGCPENVQLLQVPTEEEVQNKFKQYDTNNAGSLNKDQFRLFYVQEITRLCSHLKTLLNN